MGEEILMEYYVDTAELKGCLEDGFSPKSTRLCYDITKKEYDRVVNSKTNIKTKLGKNSPVREDY